MFDCFEPLFQTCDGQNFLERTSVGSLVRVPFDIRTSRILCSHRHTIWLTTYSHCIRFRKKPSDDQVKFRNPSLSNTYIITQTPPCHPHLNHHHSQKSTGMLVVPRRKTPKLVPKETRIFNKNNYYDRYPMPLPPLRHHQTAVEANIPLPVTFAF